MLCNDVDLILVFCAFGYKGMPGYANQLITNLCHLEIILEKRTCTFHSCFRYYVISKFPKLEVLDDKKVEARERQEAERIYRPVSRLVPVYNVIFLVVKLIISLSQKFRNFTWSSSWLGHHLILLSKRI